MAGGGIRLIELVLDRTAGGSPLNAAPASTVLDGGGEVSYDDGASWRFLFKSRVVGGTYVNDETGQVFTSWSTAVKLGQPLPPGSLIRAQVVVSGTPVSVAGSLNTS